MTELDAELRLTGRMYYTLLGAPEYFRYGFIERREKKYGTAFLQWTFPIQDSIPVFGSTTDATDLRIYTLTAITRIDNDEDFTDSVLHRLSAGIEHRFLRLIYGDTE